MFLFWPFDGGVVLGEIPELQNMIRTAPTKAIAAQTASTFSRKVRSTFRPPQHGQVRVYQTRPPTKVTNVVHRQTVPGVTNAA